MSFTSIVNSFMGNKATSSSNSSMEQVDNAYRVEWAYPSQFQIMYLHMVHSANNKNNKKHYFNDNSMLPLLNASILNVETATVNHSPLDEWIGGQWVYTTGRPELRQITFTFRETSNAWLYRNFNTAYNANRNAFPDNQKWNINLFIHGVENKNDKSRFSSSELNQLHRGTLLDTKHAIIDSISAINLDQSSADGFLTFSVTFKYINNVHNFDDLTNAVGDSNASQTSTQSSSTTVNAGIGNV